MSVRKRGKRYVVKVYDPQAKSRQRWVGTFPTQEAAVLAERLAKAGEFPVAGTRGLSWSLRSKGESQCRNCGGSAQHLHHVVPAASLDGFLFCPLEAGIPLCWQCHSGWHHRARIIYQDVLYPEERAFATATAGRAWLDANYPPRDRQPADLDSELRAEVAQLRRENRRLRAGLGGDA